MSAVKDKGNINYIQILHVQVQQKVPRKKLEKFFIIKKCTQYKTSHTLKFYLFELPDNKHFGKLFSKYEVLFLDQSNFSSNPFQILILQYPIPRDSPPPLPSLLNFILANWHPSWKQNSSCFSLAFLFYLTPFDHTP